MKRLAARQRFADSVQNSINQKIFGLLIKPVPLSALTVTPLVSTNVDSIINRRTHMRQNTPNLRLLALLLAVCTLATTEVQAQPTISSTFSLPSSAADASKPGFVWRVHQVANPQPNDNARTE